MIAPNENRAARSTDARRRKQAPQRECAKLEQFRDLLAETGHPALHSVAASLDGGRLVLRGCVPSFYLKQLAQHTALNVPGIHEIDNQLQVEPADAQ